MNLTFVLPDGLTLGGVTTWSVEMCRRLAQLNQPVALIEHASFGPKMKVTLPPEVQVISCSSQTSLLLGPGTESDVLDYALDYRRILPSVIIPNWSLGTYATCALISQDRSEALRVIGFAHANDPGYYKTLYYYEPIIHRFVAVSHEIAAGLKQVIPHRERDIIVYPYAVDAPQSLSRAYSPPPEPLQLMYAGRLAEPQKRISNLIQLVQLLEQEGVNFHLHIVGDGPDKETLYNGIEALAESSRRRVTLTGALPINQMSAAWKAADVCILVSEYEGTSISMLEAMAHGCVPVVTQVSGVAAVLRQGVNGFLVPVGDISLMAQLIKVLDQDRRKLAELGLKAHATILEHFSYDKYMPWFLGLVDEVKQRPPQVWPSDRPLLPPRSILESIQLQPDQQLINQQIINKLSSQDIAQQIPIRKIIEAIGFKIAAKPGFGWLYHFPGMGKKPRGG